MLRPLLIVIEAARQVRGWLVLPGEGALEPQSFATKAELHALLPRDGWDIAWVWTPPRASLGDQLVGLLPSAQHDLCEASTAAYLLGLEAPTADGLGQFAVRAAAELERIPDDLLAQCAALVREEAASSTLGLFAAELQRRHTALSMPPAGEVDVKYYEPVFIPTTPASRQETPVDLLERVFQARQALAGAFENYEDRPQQRAMVQAVEQALSAGRSLVVEAGTGVGKSLGYLLPLAVHTMRTGKLGIVSTNTLNLQQQLLSNDIPRLRQILDTLDPRVTLLKGREHYLCLKRLQETWLTDDSAARQRRHQALGGRQSALLFMLRALLQQQADPNGDLDTIVSSPGQSQAERGALTNGIDCGFHTCLGDKCEFKPRCHFFRTRDAAINSHIVLTNHALVFSLFKPEAEEGDTVVSRASVVVLDEAHNLEGAITSQRTLAVAHDQPVELGNDLQRLLEDPALRKRLKLTPDSIAAEQRERFARLQGLIGKLNRWVLHGAEVVQQIGRLLDQAAAKGHLEYTQQNQLTPSTATPGQQQVLELLEKLAQRLLGTVKHYTQIAQLLTSLFSNEESGLFLNEPAVLMTIQALRMRLEGSVQALEGWKPAEPNDIAWFTADLSSGEARWSYFYAPLNIGPVFQSLLAGKDSTILCSATLSVAGKFDYMQRSLGFAETVPGIDTKVDWLRLDSPFNYAEQSLLLVATDMDAPTGQGRERYLRQLEEVVVEACEIFDKGVLVLFNSYRDLNEIAGQLEGRFDERLLVQGQSGSRAEIAERFRSSGDKVLLATRSFWEGFDVAGEALTCVVLAKLPFANFKEPIHAGRQRALEAAGRSSFADYSLPQAAMQLQQGFGRLIRSRSDRGCVFLLDSRVAKARYGRIFLDSLPGPREFTGSYRDCLEAARTFMQQPAPDAAAP